MDKRYVTIEDNSILGQKKETVRILSEEEEKEIESQLSLLKEMESIDTGDFEQYLGRDYCESKPFLTVIKAYLESLNDQRRRRF